MALDAHTVDMLREHRAECERAAEMFGRRFTDRYPVFAPASEPGPRFTLASEARPGIC